MSRFQLEFSVSIKPYFILLKYSFSNLDGVKDLYAIILFLAFKHVFSIQLCLSTLYKVYTTGILNLM